MQRCEEVLRWLDRDFLSYATLIETLNKEPDCRLVAFNDDGVCVKSVFSGFTHICTKNIDFLTNSLESTGYSGTYVAYNQAIADFMAEHRGFGKLSFCYQLTYTDSRRLPICGKAEIKKLSPSEENIQMVFERYTLAYDRESIRYHLENLGVYGAYIGEKPVGFIGRHLEHTIGMLEVFPEYRRMGIGRQLVSFMTNYCLDNGIIPIAHVIDNNAASLNLLTSLGFTAAKEKICWLRK